MSDRMELIDFEHIIRWIFKEYDKTKTIFGIHKKSFYKNYDTNNLEIFGSKLDNPIGTAAGPHTQLSQNIITAFLAGARFFELKTAQRSDKLKINKPCIDANDEGYNIEWSQELLLEQSFDEYLKAWMLLPLIDEVFIGKSNYIFNMSIGYNLVGIKSSKMDKFINDIANTANNKLFVKYKDLLASSVKEGFLYNYLTSELSFDQEKINAIVNRIEQISPQISNSVTLSTMHGCPPNEIEAIAKYLITEKKLHTYVKLNPTLLGKENVRQILDANGFNYIHLEDSTFSNDLQLDDVKPMLARLLECASENKKEFGVKLSNTLGVVNKKKSLKGNEMYLSGRALFPLTINLAKTLTEMFDGKLKISFSGGASAHNVKEIFECGIFPITTATEILKPGGLSRMTEMCKEISKSELMDFTKVSLSKLDDVISKIANDSYYKKGTRKIESIKISSKLPMFDCYIAPCQVACPIHQNVAEYVTLIEQGRMEEAIKVITDKNPLPHITGYICDHQCMNHCTRWDYDTSVQIRKMKKAAAENALLDYQNKLHLSETKIDNSTKIAVIGAGPSGLTSAYFLARAGFDVTVFERNSNPGGVAQYSIPRFRLPQEAVDADINFIKSFGVKFEFDCDSQFSISQLKENGFKYIHIAIGASVSSPLKLNGMDEPTLSAIEFLEGFNHGNRPKLGKNVAVVGAGNSAMDASRAAGRCDGVESVYIVYRRTIEFMPADKEEIEGAIEDGAIIKELLQPIEFSNGKLKCQKMKLGMIEKDGRRRSLPIEDEFVEMGIDTVISAVGEKVEYSLLEANNLLDGNGNLDSTKLESSHENVFIGGDALRGPGNLIDAVADGKKIAEEIISREGASKNIDEDYSNLFSKEFISDKLISEKGKLIQTSTDNNKEAHRCLMCSIECNKCVDVCPNRANIALPSHAGFKDNYQIVHVDGMCNECGNCETFCPHNGKPYVDKITIFWTENEFQDSENNGFFILSNQDPIHLLIRFKGEENEITIEKLDEIKEKFDAETNLTDFNKFVRLIISILEDHSYLTKVSPKYYRKDVLKW